MDWLLVLALLIVVPVTVIGYAGLIYEWRDRDLPFPHRPHPSLIFRLVKRDERATYVRIMRRTYAVAMRDMGRAMRQLGRAFGKALKPIHDLAAALAEVFRKP